MRWNEKGTRPAQASPLSVGDGVLDVPRSLCLPRRGREGSGRPQGSPLRRRDEVFIGGRLIAAPTGSPRCFREIAGAKAAGDRKGRPYGITAAFPRDRRRRRICREHSALCCGFFADAQNDKEKLKKTARAGARLLGNLAPARLFYGSPEAPPKGVLGLSAQPTEGFQNPSVLGGRPPRTPPLAGEAFHPPARASLVPTP